MIKKNLPVVISSISFLIVLAMSLNYTRRWDVSFIIKPMSVLENKEKVVALTFDDGPSERKTKRILEILKKEKIRATFFMLGENIEKHRDIASSVINEGHLIGNHSYSHKRLIFQNYSVIETEIDKTNELIKSIGQKNVEYLRPPYTSKYLFLPILLKKKNMILVTGTYDPPAEYIYPIQVELLIQQVIENIEDGSIVFLHDGNDNDTEAYCLALEKMIQVIKSKGYRIIRLDEA